MDSGLTIAAASHSRSPPCVCVHARYPLCPCCPLLSIRAPLPSVLGLPPVLACPVRSELQSFLVEITSIILSKKDDKAPGYIVDKIVDQTGSKGTGMASVT